MLAFPRPDSFEICLKLVQHDVLSAWGWSPAGPITPRFTLEWKLVRRVGFELYVPLINALLAWPSHLFRIFVLRVLVRADVGRNVTIERRVRISRRGRLSIGDGTIINHGAFLDARGGLEIGSHVNISPEVRLLTADHDPDDMAFTGRERPVVVADRAWLATGAIILPGTTVGEGAIVSAGAVASGALEAWSIYVGNPATRRRSRARTAQRQLPKFRRLLH